MKDWQYIQIIGVLLSIWGCVIVFPGLGLVLKGFGTFCLVVGLFMFIIE